MADSQVKTANICNITSSTLLRPNAGGSGTYIADNSISVHMTSDGPASGIYVFSLPEQGVIGDKYTISFVPVCATNNVMYVVLYGTTTRISFTSGNRYTLTITATFADTTLAFYGADSVEKTIIIKDIQIEKGETATPYRPYSATGWVHSLRKLTTATEAVENPLYSDGTPITAYALKGNEEHTGTPTPSNPVEVNGVGVRTENLWDENYIGITTAVTYKPIYVGNGTFTLSTNTPRTGGGVANLFLLTGNVSSGGSTATDGVWSGQDRTVTATDGYVTIIYRDLDSIDPADYTTMLNTGSTAKPHEPHGYKIPISSGGVTTNIYLGSTQTVRQIRKYVFTGNETITSMSQITLGYRFRVSVPMTDMSQDNRLMSICTHFQCVSDWNELGFTPSLNGAELFFMVSDISTTTAFTAYLQQQYANGTPVTVYYVLATEKTAAVNEPLMKIGTYADTLSNAASIPTTDGANSITVDTTVQPSEFTATWIGWHDSSVKEYDGSDWN